MSHDPPVTVLATCAANGDRPAWESLVERHAPLIWSICRRYQLGDAVADDVGQAVWLQALGELRDLAVLAGWLPPQPAPNAAGPCAPRGNRKLPGRC